MRIKITTLAYLLFLGVSIGSPTELNKQEINLGNAKYQFILSGDLLGDFHSELAVTSKDTLGNISLSIFSFENESWKRSVKINLPNDVLFIDVAKVAGRQRYIFYQKGQFSWVDPEEEIIKEFFSVQFNFNSGHFKHVPWVNITFDLNEDGLDDFILPQFDGFTIYIQNEGGTFSEPLTINAPEPFLELPAMGGDPNRTYKQLGFNPITIPNYLSRVHLFDQNLDGLKDLVFRNRDDYHVYTQTDNKQFNATPTLFSVNVPMGTDGRYSLGFQSHDKVGFSSVFGLSSKMAFTVTDRFTDVNGDGVADLITHTLSGRNILKMQSKYAMYYGSETEDGIQFSNKNKSEIFPSGRAGIGEMDGYAFKWIHDFNGDGDKDLLRYDVRVSIGSILRTLLTKTVYIDYEYFQNRNNTFPQNPSMSGLLNTKFDWDAGFYPAIKHGDLNGDGKSELVMTVNPEKFHIYNWDMETDVLSSEPQSIFTTVPRSEKNTWVLDLHNDGKDNILMYLDSQSGDNHLAIYTAQ